MIADRVNRAGQRGFTLIEIMMVVGLIVIMFTVAIPTFARAHNQRAMKVVTDEMMELMHTARAQAIMRGVTMEVRINPLDQTFSVVSTGQSSELEKRVSSSSADTKRGRFSMDLGTDVRIELLRINSDDLEAAEDTVAMRFYSNGTADAFHLLVSAVQGDMRKFTVDPITGRADYEVFK
ncbi:MAG: pilus assembly FimT family protein [Limisphaerales bacterium]